MISTQSSSCVLKVQSHPFHGNVLICYNTPGIKYRVVLYNTLTYKYRVSLIHTTANLERATLSHYQRTEEVYTPLDISVFIGYIHPR